MDEELDITQKASLRTAIRLFARQGYAATSTRELRHAMEIGRQSMYEVFGDKKSLFLKAFELHLMEYLQGISSDLQQPGPALAVIRASLIAFADRIELPLSDDYIWVIAVSELGPSDPDVAKLIRKTVLFQRRILTRILGRAKLERQLQPDADVRSLAEFFEATITGIRTEARTGKSRRSLRKTAALAGTIYVA